MAAGKHVITTNYSAHTEFCTQDNSTLIPITNVEPAFDGKWFFGQGNWAKVGNREVALLAHEMCMFAEMYKGEQNISGIETAKTFSWQNTAREIIKCLKE